ncbi:MAG: Fic family protein [Sulfuricaulis sp.]|uniref:Fic/DOC family protein n=1 Tax=Sulfuricaulis sp. TaxID=2003553 RepID=UPI0034A54BF5
MKKDGRYDVSDLPEAQFEPGSNEQVLRNRLGIKSPNEMDDAEARALGKVMTGLVRKYDERHNFTAADIRDIHRHWLGEIYEWAGEYRQVNVSKGEFPFAAAARVPDLMAEYERNVLARYTPCNFKDRVDVTRALAETHVELVLIHPFREGNGRAARILSILMALQAGLPPLNFSSIAEEKKQEYFSAVQAGLDKNYAPMERLFAEIIERSLGSS